MAIEIKIPSPGESISEVELATWFVENGDFVKKDQEVGEIESEKATLPLIAEKSGKIELLAEVGDTLKVGDVACKIDTDAEEEADDSKEPEKDEKEEQEDAKKEGDGKAIQTKEINKEQAGKNTDGKDSGKEKPKSEHIRQNPEAKSDSENTVKEDSVAANAKVTPVARKIMQEEGLSVDDIINGLRKISSSEVNAVKEFSLSRESASVKKTEVSREETRNTLSQLRKKISERLVSVKNETAMLTTFNEADMSAVMNLRKKYKDKFQETHGVKLGIMSFFTKAVTLALQQFPNVNSFIDGEEIVTPAYCDVGIAVQTEKGLMVPIIRNTETLGLADIEKKILEIAGRARKNRISMDELSGGTFSITNGGVFGSMLSTPILNPPQSAILGMHNIIDRPVAVNGKVEIRPMMYLALSYDHRVIDGKDSVGFLKAVKEFIEEPASMLYGLNDPYQQLLEF